MMDWDRQFDGMSRVQVERIAIIAQRMLEARERDARQAQEQLTVVQARCTELLEENRRLRAGILLPGWTCPSCQGFSGTEKGATECRCCGAARPA